MSWFLRERRPPTTRFVVLFPGRTGSTYLISCLDRHGAIVAEGERLVRRSPSWQQRWIRKLYTRPRVEPISAVGFKTKLKDVWHLDGFADVLRKHEVSVIEMRRSNLVKLAVSTLNAKRLVERSGRWNRDSGIDPLPPLDVEPAVLEAEIVRCDEQQRMVGAFVARLGLRTLRLDYEGLLADRVAWLERALAFLHVNPVPLDGDVVKTTDDDLRVALAGYQRHEEHFAGGPYADAFNGTA